ncbi:hypothetical protein EC957_011679 [Mortierella hygrophila]|uniref:Uncharacterized protein n=1 Tax=Mortierella hygrophila TaxID=979708 RepID=A0A9P6K383_9FUNG|nr:hypothetical protein EC957_011679 [Mortierella hygrophila]
MLKSTLLLALAALSVYVTMADARIDFWVDQNLGGEIITCPKATQYNTCYNVDNVALAGISSYFYYNQDPAKKDFSVTVYSGGSCSGTYDRWSFTIDPDPAKDQVGFYVLEFATMNDKTRSFKFADFHTSFVKGGTQKTPDEYKVSNVCQFGFPKGASRSLPPLSRAIRG